MSRRTTNAVQPMNNIDEYIREIQITNRGYASWVAWDEFNSMGKYGVPQRTVGKFQWCLFCEFGRDAL